MLTMFKDVVEGQKKKERIAPIATRVIPEPTNNKCFSRGRTECPFTQIHDRLRKHTCLAPQTVSHRQGWLKLTTLLWSVIQLLWPPPLLQLTDQPPIQSTVMGPAHVFK